MDEMLTRFQEMVGEDAPAQELFEDLKDLYRSSGDHDKQRLFSALVDQMDVPKAHISPLLEQLGACGEDDPAWPGLLSQLRKQIFSPRNACFQKIAHLPGGLKFLLDFRGDLLAMRRHLKVDPEPLDVDIVSLFESWFQEGFLYLEEITLNSPYRQIEIIKDRDMVHPMASIQEMGQRLGRDRRCFALYHRLLPYEPVVFIEVALTHGLASSITEIMAGSQEEEGSKDTAIFYSINNSQNGLSGLGMGKMLIGKVVDYLRQENDRIRTFATLSPIPGFWERYLKPILEGRDEPFSLKKPDVLDFFSRRARGKIMARSGKTDEGPQELAQVLGSVLSGRDWVTDEEWAGLLKTPLTKIAYHYIAAEKNAQDKPLNPVAGFHLGNGASVSERNIHFLANPSPKGLQESCGLMVNYVYSSDWLSQIRRSFRWFDRLEIRDLLGRKT